MRIEYGRKITVTPYRLKKIATHLVDGYKPRHDSILDRLARRLSEQETISFINQLASEGREEALGLFETKYSNSQQLISDEVFKAFSLGYAALGDNRYYKKQATQRYKVVKQIGSQVKELVKAAQTKKEKAIVEMIECLRAGTGKDSADRKKIAKEAEKLIVGLKALILKAKEVKAETFVTVRAYAEVSEAFEDILDDLAKRVIADIANGAINKEYAEIVNCMMADKEYDFFVPAELMPKYESLAQKNGVNSPAGVIFNASYTAIYDQAKKESVNGENDKALSLYKEAWDSYPNKKLGKEIAEFLYSWSQKIEVSSNEWVEKLEEVLSFNPDHFKALAKLARAYLLADQHEKAIDRGERAKKQDPRGIWNRLTLARAYLERGVAAGPQRQKLNDLNVAGKSYLFLGGILKKIILNYQGNSTVKEEDKQMIESFYLSFITGLTDVYLARNEIDKAINLATELKAAGRAEEAAFIMTKIPKAS
ncbi:MAG: hypothetical protein ABIH50_04420 [bacterium]